MNERRNHAMCLTKGSPSTSLFLQRYDFFSLSPFRSIVHVSLHHPHLSHGSPHVSHYHSPPQCYTSRSHPHHAPSPYDAHHSRPSPRSHSQYSDHPAHSHQSPLPRHPPFSSGGTYSSP